MLKIMSVKLKPINQYNFWLIETREALALIFLSYLLFLDRVRS